jgi:hypothetical protein
MKRTLLAIAAAAGDFVGDPKFTARGAPTRGAPAGS